MAQPPRQLKSRRIEDSGIDAFDYDSKRGKYRVRLERPDFDGHLGVRSDAGAWQSPAFSHARLGEKEPSGGGADLNPGLAILKRGREGRFGQVTAAASFDTKCDSASTPGPILDR